MKKHSVVLAAVTAGVLSLGVVPAAQAEIRVGANFRLNSDPDPFRQKDQLGVAVNPANRQHVVAIMANYLDLRCEATVSRDGGTTWSPAVPLLLPDVGAEAPWDTRCNFHQSVRFGSGQNVYAAVTAARTTTSSPDSAVLVYRSTTGGDTWQRAVVVMEAGPGTNTPVTAPSPGPSYQRPSIAVDPGRDGAPDKVYAVGRDFRGFGNSGTAPACTSACAVVKVAASTNSGQTFSAPVNASPVGVSAQDPPPSVVNSDGSITVAWRTVGRRGMLQAARSTDQGQTWSAPVDIATVTNNARLGVGGSHIPPAPDAPDSEFSTTATYPRMTADPASGRIYLVYGQGPPFPLNPDSFFLGADHFITYDSQVWFQRSSDFGRTWSKPKRVSDPTPYPGSQTIQTRQPNVSVSPGGRVDVVWHDRRHWFQGPGERNCTHSHIYCEDIRLGDTYHSFSTDGGTTFSRNLRINDRSHNNDVGADTRPAGYWSWGPQAVTVADDQILIAWMDTREGNWDTDTEDIYLAKVNLNASGADPQTNIDEPDVVSRSVRLSKIGYQGGNEGALVGGPRDPLGAGGGPSSRNASAVVIVNESDVASAMAATVLARANPAPVLLSPASGLPASVKAEITRIRPAAAFVVGSADQLSEQVRLDAAAAAGILQTRVRRISGAGDAATAALIAGEMDYRTTLEKDADQPAFDAAVIANPATPDAAAAVGLAAARRLPMLYVSRDEVPAQTLAALDVLDIKKLIIIGGTDEVSAGVQSQLDALPKVTEPVTRRGGATQYDTSRGVVAESDARGMPSNIVYVADGANPMDATLLGGVVARATGMLMLAPAPLHSTGAAQAQEFGLTGIDRFVLLGPAAGGVTPPPDVTPPPPPVAPPPVAPPPPPPPPAAVPPPPAATAEARPVLSRVSLTRRAFKARLGTTIRFTLSKDAKVRIVVARRSVGRRVGKSCVALTRSNRRRRPCVRYVTRGTLTSNRKKGTTRVRFSGRLAGRFLAPAGYRFTLRATDSGGRRSNAVNVAFRVVRR